MSDNLEKNLKQIAELLSKDDVADSLKRLLGNVLSQESKPEEDTGNTEKEHTGNGISRDDMKTMENIVRAASEIRNSNDPTVGLLMSLKPFLRQTRHKALKDCVKMLQMAKVYEYMQENEDILNK